MPNPSKTTKDGFELAGTRRALPIALLRAREQVMSRFRPWLNENDVTEQQWRVLRVLAELDGAEASKVAEHACVLTPSLTRMIKALEAREFIAQERDAQDGRKTILRLTQHGRDFMAQVSQGSAKIYEAIEETLGRERIERILDELEFIEQALRSKK